MRRKRLPNGLKKMRKLDKGCLKFGKRLSDVILTLMKTKQPLSLEDISRERGQPPLFNKKYGAIYSHIPAMSNDVGDEISRPKKQ